MVSIQTLVKRRIEIPSPPAIALQIPQEVKKKHCSVDNLSKVILADPALVPKIPRITNFSFYGMPSSDQAARGIRASVTLKI